MKNSATLFLFFFFIMISTSCRKEVWDNILLRSSGIWIIESLETTQINYDGTTETVISDFDEAYWRFYLGPDRVSTCEVYGLTDGESVISLPVYTFDSERLSLYDGNSFYTYTIEELNRSRMVLSRYTDAPGEDYTLKVHIEFSSCSTCKPRVDYDGIVEPNI